jgi:dTDP-4-amino-4,6-dideoxygalactose transaminase
LYKKLLSLRNLGSIKKHEYDYLGINSRLDTLQAVVLKQKLRSILKLNQSRRKIAKIYDNNLDKIKEIILTKTKPGSTYHLYVVKTKKRDSLQRYLKSKKIYCQIHYPYSLNKLKPFKKYIKNTKLRNSEQWSRECISLPMHPNLQINQVYRVVHEIMKYFKY